MASYSQIRKKASVGKYARGGRVEKKGARTVINVIVPPSQGAAPMPAPAAAPPPAPSGPPVPPAAAAMALNQMQGKPGMPGAFARGGRIPGPSPKKGGTIPAKPSPTSKKDGASSGEGRLQKITTAKRTKKVTP